MSRTGRLTTLVVLLLLGACASLTKKEPFTTYSPRYTASPKADGTPVRWQLSVDTPLASDAIDTTRMLVMPMPGALEAYKGGRWADTAPLLLRSLLIQAFQDSNRIAAVGAVTSGLHGDFLLAIDLYDFETQYESGSPRATIRLNAKLVDQSLNRVTAAHTFDGSAPVAGAGAAEASAAFEQALGELLPQIVAWTLDSGETAWTKSARSSSTSVP
ncbi:MAG TPA: ABC-type transport auxiliary lipoprotein family protein [Rhodanobacteraceae bacterium]|nr:ABC-type transport auxiliary lipoprotein family protein [Rhodanobacteraceae bacterium]